MQQCPGVTASAPATREISRRPIAASATACCLKCLPNGAGAPRAPFAFGSCLLHDQADSENPRVQPLPRLTPWAGPPSARGDARTRSLPSPKPHAASPSVLIPIPASSLPPIPFRPAPAASPAGRPSGSPPPLGPAPPSPAAPGPPRPVPVPASPSPRPRPRRPDPRLPLLAAAVASVAAATPA